MHTASDVRQIESTALKPLDGIRVVEVGQAVCAPLCARHLADLGADVIKVESPAGDLARRYDDVVCGDSAYFAWANYGKRSVVLDLRSDAGRENFGRLVARADVLIHNLGPGAMARLGFGPADLAALNPRLIDCSISGYGVGGPLGARKAFDLLVQGESGLMSVTGTADSPAKVGVSIVDMCTAMYALTGIQAALFERMSTGIGRRLEIAMLDCMSEWMMAPAFHQIHTGQAPKREGARHNMMVPYGVYRTGEQTSVNFAIQTDLHWHDLCEKVLQAPELERDPRYATNAQRVANRDLLEPELERLLTAIGHREVVRRLLVAEIPVGEVNDLSGLVEHPQLRERDRWMEIVTHGQITRTIRPPFSAAAADDESPARVPALGEHTDAVISELGSTDRPV